MTPQNKAQPVTATQVGESALEAARLAALGYAVVQVYPIRDGVCSCGEGGSCGSPGKHPIGGDSRWTSDPATVAAWWAERPDANLGLNLAASGVMDVSADSSSTLVDFRSRGMEPTAAWQSGSGPGHEHHLYRRPEGCPTTRKCETGVLDLMTSGIAVVPPSVSGKGEYAAIRPIDRRPDELPVAMPWAVDELRKQRERDDHAVIDRAEPPVPLTGEALERWEGRLLSLTPSGDVDTSKSLLRIANDLARAGMTANGIDAALKGRASEIGLGKFEAGRSDREVRYAEMATSAVARHPNLSDFAVDLSRLVPRPVDRTPRFRTLAELATRGVPPWLVYGHLQANSLVMLVGDPGTYKSFTALDLSLCVASGRPWHGHRVRTGPVAYIAGEGDIGLVFRAEAWLRHHGVEAPVTFGVLGGAYSLADRSDAGRKVLGEALKEFTTRHGPPALVVVDTLDRAFGGGNENATDDMGRFVGNCDAIRTAFDCTVLVVHHNNKAGGYRGSSALLGAVDTEIEAKRSGGTVLLRCAKQRGAEEFKEVRLIKRPVTLDRIDEEGQALVSLVFEPAPKAAAVNEDGTFAPIDLHPDEAPLTVPERKVLDALLSLKPGEEVRFGEWKRLAGMEANGRFRKYRQTLIDRGLVIQIEGDRPNDSRYRAAVEEEGS